MIRYLYSFLLLFFFSASASEYDQFADKIGQKVGIAIVAFNRPDYLKPVIESLERNSESQELPFFFFLDGGPRATQSENTRLIEESTIKHKFIIRRECNYGCPKNHIDSRRFMFDICGFEKVIVVEDDLVVSKTYIKTLLNFDAWAKRTYRNIGSVQLWSYCYFPANSKKKCLHVVRETNPEWSFVSYCLDKQVWNAISPLLYEYESKFCDPFLSDEFSDLERSKPMFRKDPYAIREWMQGKMVTYDRAAVLKAWYAKLPILHSEIDLSRMASASSFFGNQDNMMCLAMWLAGYTRLQTLVNRGIHIGKAGLSYEEERWETSSDSRVVLDEFEEDPGIAKFILNRRLRRR